LISLHSEPWNRFRHSARAVSQVNPPSDRGRRASSTPQPFVQFAEDAECAPEIDEPERGR
jgi:hypothetical protein